MDDAAEARRQRLEAMRRQRVQVTPAETPDAPQPRAGRQGGQGGGGGRGLVLQRLRRILYQPAADSPEIAGTNVREQNLVQLMKLLRQRSANAEGRGAKVAVRAIRFLEQDDGGPKTVENVSIGQLKKFLARAEKGAAGRPGGGRRGQASPGMASGGQGRGGAGAMGVLQSMRDEMRNLNQRIDQLEETPGEKSKS